MRLRRGRLGLLCVLLLLIGAAPARAALEILLKPEAPDAPTSDPTYENPVLTGDYPDPSVIRAPGGGWLAAVTSDGWMPPFSILYSPDLVSWRVVGSVLRRRPPWGRQHFWAPEVVHRGSRYLVYYAARDKRGRFCVGIAWSRQAVGHFRDEGPVVCSQRGAIDPLPVLDERGRPNLVWKEDGNAVGKPTPIMAAPLTPDGLELAGPARELFRGDAAWEGGIVEAPTVTRHEGRLYILYSAGRCCGASCDYTTGVARSERLYGRWEKHPGPILSGNSGFHCPGHGSVVRGPWGQEYFVYHAYWAHEPVLAGRQLLVDRLDWAASGWPRVNGGHGPSRSAVSPLYRRQPARRPPVFEEFSGSFLDPAWQWPAPRTRLRLDSLRGGRLLVRAGSSPGMAGRQPSAATYAAEAVVGRRSRRARPGLAVHTARAREVGIELRGRRVAAWRSRGRGTRTLASMRAPRGARQALRVEVAGGRRFTFRVLAAGRWRTLGPAGYRPPFRLATPRVVLRVGGARLGIAAFERFRMAGSRAPRPPWQRAR